MKLWVSLLVVLGLAWWLHGGSARQHPPGELAPADPVQSAPEDDAAHDYKGFAITPLADFALTARVLSRKDYGHDREAQLAPTDLALGWGALSDPLVVDQLKFPQYNSFYSRFVVPELRSGSELSRRPWRELDAMFVAFTHVHTIPGDRAIRATLAGIRPGQVIRFRATLVEATAPSGGRYTSSLKLGDRDCEIAWIDELELE